MTQNIKEKRQFNIKKFRDTIEESRKEILEFIISTLYHSDNCIDTPKSCKRKITQCLLEQGQFKQEEIDKTFSSNKEPIVELNYNFPFSDCSYKEFIGYCKMKLELLKCPDCGNEVTNTPDNVTYGYEHNLVYTGTDYFAILHPICSKSPRKDKKGFMEVNGVWVDDCGRIVLSLECKFCGARNALKPHAKEGEIPLLNESGAKWKRIESPILEMIKKGENDNVEFKSSLRWDYKRNNINNELEYEVSRASAGFMNANGGFLLIGVDDYKNVLGLEKDYNTLKEKKNEDGFELQFTEVMNRYIGKEYRKFLNVVFENIYGKNEFVIRQGNRTQTLDAKETIEHIKMNWRR
jgi:hypothetical protein